jgi:hypothetical protein
MAMTAVRVIAASGIGVLPRWRTLSLLSLFFIPSAAQAILLTVVPLEALHLLGAARAVTLLYIGLDRSAGGRSLPWARYHWPRAVSCSP